MVVKHALRAGLTPIVTAAGLDLAFLLGGAIIAENIFSLPGLGSLAVGSVTTSDLPVITGITLLKPQYVTERRNSRHTQTYCWLGRNRGSPHGSDDAEDARVG